MGGQLEAREERPAAARRRLERHAEVPPQQRAARVEKRNVSEAVGHAVVARVQQRRLRNGSFTKGERGRTLKLT